MRDESASLLDPAFLAQLARLTLRARGLFTGLAIGERRSLRRGTGVEFAGHRGYVPGDDLRHLDWAALGRLDRAFVKTFEEEQDQTVHLLVDTSRSMSFGEPSKLRAATRIAAALAHVALASLDRVGAALFDGRGLRLHAPARGQGALFPLLGFLESAKAEGPGEPASALKLHAAASRPGLTVVLSDFFDPSFLDFLAAHRARRHALVLVQVLAPEELDPTLDGDLRLVDVETGETVDVTVGARERAAYLARLEGLRADLVRFGRRNRCDVFSVSSATPLAEVVFSHLLKGTLLSG